MISIQINLSDKHLFETYSAKLFRSKCRTIPFAFNLKERDVKRRCENRCEEDVEEICKWM
jgi:hypothetical protein